MGRRSQNHHHVKSHTLPSSPTHSFSSSSSSDFEFTISISPRKSFAALCPADELFYKGQLLPLHLSPRLSMVRTLLSSASTSSSSDTTTTASRDSTASHSSSDSSTDINHMDCDSSRPSSVTDEELRRLTTTTEAKKPSKYFSLSKFFRKENKNPQPQPSSVKRVSSSAKEVICKYLKKVKPLYEKLSQKQQKMSPTSTFSRSAKTSVCLMKDVDSEFKSNKTDISMSFSGNLRYPRKRSCVSSCPSSMRSSPSHGKSGFTPMSRAGGSGYFSDNSSSMEELQSAIQGAIAHCKNSMVQNKGVMVSNEI